MHQEATEVSTGRMKPSQRPLWSATSMIKYDAPVCTADLAGAISTACSDERPRLSVLFSSTPLAGGHTARAPCGRLDRSVAC